MRCALTSFGCVGCLTVAGAVHAQAQWSPAAPSPAVVAAPTGVATAEPPTKPEPPNAPVPMKGKWNPVFYGFAELDMLHDSTQSFTEPAGNGAILRDDSFGGQHGRTQFGVRNSRFGVRLAAPEFEGIKASGMLEVDFLGNQPPGPYVPAPSISEAAFFNNPTLRLRHFLLRIEDPYVDVLAGQYWQLFGWQTFAHVNTVQIQGVPGQIFSRTPQLRLSHTFTTDLLNIDVAAAAARPPQRDSEIPDFQGGVRFLVNGWKGVHTAGGAASSADPLGIGISGVGRRFAIPEHITVPVGRVGRSGWGVSVDAMLPIVRATMDERGNALTFTGSYVTGSGIADLYTGMTNGGAPAYPAPAMGAAVIAPVDAGLLAFDSSNRLHTIDVTSYILGLQYYLPPAGRVWISANYSHVIWGNIDQFGLTPSLIFTDSDWADGNLFWDLSPAIRFGGEYSFFKQTRADGQKPENHRFQVSAWFIF